MVPRLLVGLFVFTPAVFAQDSIPLKAGDRAPDIDWTKIVHSPESTKDHPILAGQYTVLQFLPNLTSNPDAIGIWNNLIFKFADKPVQFLWIASEPWSAVEPFLRAHPLNGWLLIDEKRAAELAYGCQLCGDVIIDPSGNIAGFTQFLEAEQLAAVLDGKAVVVPGDAKDSEVLKLVAGGKVRLDREPGDLGPPGMAYKPDIPPSYEVHISPSKADGTEDNSGPDFWVLRGFDLKAIVSLAYEKDVSQVSLPKSLDNDNKFDIVVVLPDEENETAIHQLVQRAIERHFKVSAAVESKPSEVYVMTALKDKMPPAKNGSEGFVGFSSSSAAFSLPEGTPRTPESIEKAMQEMLKHPGYIRISNLTATNTTMNEFRKDLEERLGRPIIDETGLKGVYDLEVHGHAGSNEEFIRMLREQTGLVLTPDTRNIDVLILQSTN